jgi:predicted ATPase/DNA-binding CsgD family transcriptional regulator
MSPWASTGFPSSANSERFIGHRPIKLFAKQRCPSPVHGEGHHRVGRLRTSALALSCARAHTSFGDASVKAPGNLPGQLTNFIGREATVTTVSRLLQTERLVSLVGPGGCGKTRLAIEVGRDVTSQRPDGVFFVDLSGTSDPGLVPGTVLSVLGLRATRGRGPVETLLAQLSDQDVLLVLDNCEHLVDPCASLADTLVRGCPRVWALATSRERLGLTSEVIVAVGGLELPDRDSPDREGWLENSEAGRLFIERAERARPGFALDHSDVEAVARICERLDGIPLALELAAARARLMSVHAIAEGLSDRFHLLVGNGRAGPSRQKTLLASIEWSCALLSEEERALLRRLAVFASGFDLAAAEAVCAGGEIADRDVLGLLTSLVDKSLVQVDPGADRFGLHETMRAYSGTALKAEGGTAATRDRHLAYFTGLARAIQPTGLTSEIASALAVLEANLDNLRAALDWCVESGQLNACADLLGALGPFFDGLRLWPEAWSRCERLLAADLEPMRRTDLLYFAARSTRNSDPSTSLRLSWELSALGRSAGYDWAVASGLFSAANIQAWAQPDEALTTADEAIDVAQKAGFPKLAGLGLHNKAWAYFWLGRPEEALSTAEGSEGAARDEDYLWGLVNARTVSSIAATYSGLLARGLQEAEDLLRLSTELSAPRFACWAERHRGEAYTYLGDAGALGAFARAMALAEPTDDPFNVACTRTGQGHLQVSLGRDDAGYALLEEGNSNLEALGFGRMCVNNRAVLSEVALRRGDPGGARQHLEACTWRLPRTPDPEGVPVLRAEARLARSVGDWSRSYRLACDGLGQSSGAGHKIWAIDMLELVAITVSDLARPAEAARLLGAAESLREATGYRRWAPARDELAPVLLASQKALGQQGFEQALSEGRGLTLQEAVAYAHRRRGSHSRSVSGWDSLTRSERRVVSLVAEHLSNAEIANKLFVSTPTVKSHLTRVFAKLGVTDRHELAEIATVRMTGGRR